MKDPAFRCGVVEGFYGRPWSDEQRHRLFRWMSDWDLNSYLYAPKDDLKHRARWRELYTRSELLELGRVIRESRRGGVSFSYGIGPGLDLRFASRSDIRALERKLGQLQSAGCRSFALLFDDVPLDLRTDDRKQFGTPARAQAEVANGLLRFLDGRAELLFCPTAYCGRMAGAPLFGSRYLVELGKRLDEAIDIFWTGPEIVSETISVAGIREVRQILRRKPVLWDNLHANDYDLCRIYVGPYAGRSTALRSELAGIVANPNSEFEANYVPLRTLAAYAHTRASWHPRRAYRAALRAWLGMWKVHGSQKITLGDLEILGDCLYLPHLHGDRIRRWMDDLRILFEKPPARWGRSEKRFQETCHRLEGLYERMTTMVNRDLLHTFYPFIWQLKEEALLLRRYAVWLKHAPPGVSFVSSDHRPGVYRGGLIAELQRLLPMDGQGRFPVKQCLSGETGASL